MMMVVVVVLLVDFKRIFMPSSILKGCLEDLAVNLENQKI
jgi:hypothetical protein